MEGKIIISGENKKAENGMTHTDIVIDVQVTHIEDWEPFEILRGLMTGLEFSANEKKMLALALITGKWPQDLAMEDHSETVVDVDTIEDARRNLNDK